jgi:hypothetical protein
LDTGYFTILGLVAVGVLYRRYRAKRPHEKGRAGWVGFGVLAILSAGLFFAARAGSESLTWFFGLSLMAAVPIMLFVAIGSAVGSLFGRGKRDSAQDE